MKKSATFSTFSKKGFTLTYLICCLSVFNFTLAAPIVQAKVAKKQILAHEVNLILSNFNKMNISHQSLNEQLNIQKNVSYQEKEYKKNILNEDFKNLKHESNYPPKKYLTKKENHLSNYSSGFASPSLSNFELKTLNFTNAPTDFPIQFRCASLIDSVQSIVSKPCNKRSA